MKNRDNRLQRLSGIAVLVVEIALAANCGKAAITVQPEEMREKSQWFTRRFSDPRLERPFSFAYGGQSSAELMRTWPMKKQTKDIDKHRAQHTCTWTDPKTWLEVRCVAVEYFDFPVVEWTVYFKNTGTKDTPILKDIQGLNETLQRNDGGEFVLYGNKGDFNAPDSYQPYKHTLGPGAVQRFAPSGGAGTCGAFPYYKLHKPGGGLMLAIGWPGQWASSFARDGKTGLRITAGQELTHLMLKPGEEIRSPLIAMLFWQGDDLARAQNLWRRWMVAHNLPRTADGELPAPQLSGNNQHEIGMTTVNQENQKEFIDLWLERGLKLDSWWLDAGWFDCQGDWWLTGTWEADKTRFPHGLRPVSDHAHSKGVKFITWFEPERVGGPNSWLAKNHPAWLLSGALLNLGEPAARQWLTDHIDHTLREQGIDIYRQDFNIPPLGIWRAKDAPDRQGITENLHIQGYLGWWDELRRRQPNLRIDSCASGGRRNDLETMRRAVPLHRSDYNFEPNSQQCHHYGMAMWIPYTGAGYIVGKSVIPPPDCPNAPVPNDFDAYFFRSAMSPSVVLCVDVRRKDLNYDLARRLFAQFRKVSPYYLCDFYPLTPYTLGADVWMAWQYDKPESGEGVVQAFRRSTNEETSKTFHLFGLDPAATYTLTNLDTDVLCEATGKDLMEKGLTVEIKAKPGAAVITYRRSGLPFTMTTAVRDKVSLVKPEHIPDSPNHPMMIDGQVWVMYSPNPYNNPCVVARYRGPDLEHLEQQPDGRFDCSDSPLPGGWQASSFINSGLWYDKSTSTLYALLHTEYEHDTLNKLAGWCRKKVRLATSKDLGLSWTLVGDVLTSCYKDLNEWSQFSGTEFEVGPADYDLYVDERSGYFYVTGWNGFILKKGPMDVTQMYVDVARCPIADKMAPGKWHKFCNGTWTEPGLRGKSSRVPMDYHGLYGATIYNTYLKKYIRIGVIMGTGDRDMVRRTFSDGSIMISTCTDLALQDWSAAAKLLDQPANRAHGYTLADADKKNGVACGRAFHIYNYWSGQPSRVIDVTLGEGTTPALAMPAGPCYSCEPHPEAGDALECRKTKIVGSASPEITYAGSGWNVEKDPLCYQGEARKCTVSGNSVSFTFKGADIYWRAVGAADAGKADVSIDGVFQATVDCWFRDPDCSLPKMLAFVRKGLDPNATHTIKIDVRGDANPASKGTAIRHVGFEHSAESYRAQAGFSSVQGKNQWRYQSWDGKSYLDLETYDVQGCCWRGKKCSIGFDWQRADGAASSPARTWLAPHDGYVCIDGRLATDGEKVVWDPVVTYVDVLGDKDIPASPGGKFNVGILKNDAESLIALSLPPNSAATNYKVYAKVTAGDKLHFTVSVAQAERAYRVSSVRRELSHATPRLSPRR
jgi:alpha-galactosidase